VSNKKGKRSKKAKVKKGVSPTAALLEDSKDELKKTLKKVDKTETEGVTKRDLQSAIQDAIGKLKPISDQVHDNKRVSKEDLETAIGEVIDSLIPVSDDEIKHALSKQDLQTEIKDAKANLKKFPEASDKKRVLKKDLETAIQDALESLQPVSKSDKKRALSKQDFEIAIKDVISSLRPVAEEKINHALAKQDLQSEIRDVKKGLKKVSDSEKKHVLTKQDLQSEIRDAKGGLKKLSASERRHALTKKDLATTIKDARANLTPVFGKVQRPQMSVKQLRTAIKDSQSPLQAVPDSARNLATATLGETIKEEGDKIKRELLPIPGDVQLFEIKNLSHIKEFLADKTEYKNQISYWQEKERKPLLKITINPRTQFNKIELLDEKEPLSINNLIMGGDLVQFGQAYRFLLRYGYMRIENPYPLLLEDNQWYIWHLKEEINLTFIDIAYARNTSVREVRSVFQTSDDHIHQILDFAVYGGHYQLVAAHAMKKRGVLIQKIGDTVIETSYDNYSAEEALLKEISDTKSDSEEEQVPRVWTIKAAYKTESFLGGRYLWKEWLGDLNDDKLLMMDNYELPVEEQYMREALGFGGNLSPDIPSNFKKLISLFKNVPEEMLKIGEAAYFIANIDSLYSSQFWNIKNFIGELSVKKWRIIFIKLAIKAYLAALKKYTLKNSPLLFATTHNDLGNFYSSLAEIENKVENYNFAISSYKEALQVFSVDLFVHKYSQVNHNLGLAYQTLAELEEKEVNSKYAIFSYKEAILGRDLANFPFDHGVTLVNQGAAYQTLSGIEANEYYSTFAIDSYNAALRTGTLDKMPTERAMIYSNIGVAYRLLAETQEKSLNCKQALLVLHDALTVRNQAQFPFEYAISTTILGDIYTVLSIEENKKENINHAISSYDKATKIFIKKNEDFYDNVIERKKIAVRISKSET
jgi:tetratricopeptide (TPR) repeat protein/methyl-accepting chemotaxis protein